MPQITASLVRVEGDLAYVSLTKGLEAVVDVCDLPLVLGGKWTAQVNQKGIAYARRHGPGMNYSLMHRTIMGAEPGQCVDHIDGDGLNNRRSNLRLATTAQNNMNRLASRKNRLGIKGVSTQRGGRFSARIQHGDLKLYLGSFETPQDASAAYYGAARVLFGDFARK